MCPSKRDAFEEWLNRRKCSITLSLLFALLSLAPAALFEAQPVPILPGCWATGHTLRFDFHTLLTLACTGILANTAIVLLSERQQYTTRMLQDLRQFPDRSQSLPLMVVQVACLGALCLYASHYPRIVRIAFVWTFILSVGQAISNLFLIQAHTILRAHSDTQQQRSLRGECSAFPNYHSYNDPVAKADNLGCCSIIFPFPAAVLATYLISVSLTARLVAAALLAWLYLAAIDVVCPKNTKRPLLRTFAMLVLTATTLLALDFLPGANVLIGNVGHFIWSTVSLSTVVWGLGVVPLVGIMLLVRRYIRFWLDAKCRGVHVSMSDIIRMTHKNISPAVIITCLKKAQMAGIQVNVKQLESHYIARGDVHAVVDALIRA